VSIAVEDEQAVIARERNGGNRFLKALLAKDLHGPDGHSPALREVQRRRVLLDDHAIDTHMAQPDRH
jgi:hypothetical protein